MEECIDSTFVSSVGPFVTQLEKELADYCGVKRAIAIVNGTSALHTAMNVIGVEYGDEVITQGLTFVATANAISYCGAHPIFVDVDLNSMGMSADALLSFLDSNAERKENQCFNKKTGKRISACIPMHTYGFATEIDRICSICKNWNIPVIEDAAEAIGSTLNKQHLGTFGDIGVLSFNGNKLITAGGGGAIITNNISYAERAKHISTTAKTPHKYEFHHDELGYNYRMPNLNAALLCAQLEQINIFLSNKRELAETYKAYFDSIDVNFKWETQNSKANFWMMSIEADSKKDRDDFLALSNQAGVMTRPVWQLMHKLPMYKDCFRDEQTNAQFLEDRIVNIPSSYRPHVK